MNNQALTTKLLWQRLKSFASRVFATLKFVLVSAFVALMFVVTNYIELREVVLSLLDERTVNLIKDAVKILYGSSSVFVALEQTAILVAMPAIGILVKAVCTQSFVNLIIWLICCLGKTLSCNQNAVLSAATQRERPLQFSKRHLTLCKFIC